MNRREYMSYFSSLPRWERKRHLIAALQTLLGVMVATQRTFSKAVVKSERHVNVLRFATKTQV
jgi:hypothetical protein